jgi:hypothetical protein
MQRSDTRSSEASFSAGSGTKNGKSKRHSRRKKSIPRFQLVWLLFCHFDVIYMEPSKSLYYNLSRLYSIHASISEFVALPPDQDRNSS